MIRDLVDNYKKLKILIFKNWKWSDMFFNLKEKSNLEKIELINNKINVVEFWCMSNLNIIRLEDCSIDHRFMSYIPHEFYCKLIKNYRGNFTSSK
jgi:hypothetical protein